jgi:aminopeptidase N
MESSFRFTRDVNETSRAVRTAVWLCLAFVLTAPLVDTARSEPGDFFTERARPHFTRDRSYDVHHFVLELQFEASQSRVKGKVTTTLSPLGFDRREIAFDAVDLEIHSVSTGDGRALTYSYTGDQVLVQLDRPRGAGDTLDITIEYSGSPKQGLYFVRPEKAYPDKPWQIWSQGEMIESRHWFPCFDAPNDMMTSELIVTVPGDQQVISNGALLDVQENKSNGTRTFHWRESAPHVTYLTSLVAGTFEEIADQWDGIPISYYVEPRDAEYARRAFGKTPDMMRYFSSAIGYRYPYEKYAQVAVSDFRWGGMENISATTLTRRTFRDERAELDSQSDGLVAHELAHQWWGDLITTKNWAHIWLNEGFATYFDYLYTEEDQGHDEFMARIHGARSAYFLEDSSDYRRPLVTPIYEHPEQLFDRHAYQKGALTLHMIRGLLGDELWWKSISHYAHTFAHQNVVTEDFRTAIEDVTGQSMEWFFDQWMYKAGFPDFVVSWSWEARSSSVLINIRQMQQVDSLTPYFQMPVDIKLSGVSDTLRVTIDTRGAEQSIYLPFSSRPNMVEFDPDGWVLCKLAFEKTKQELLTQLEWGSTGVSRKRAATWLGKQTPNQTMTATLARCLQKDPVWDVRGQAALSLGEIRTPEAQSALVASLADPEARVRSKVVEALGKFKNNEEVARALETLLNTDESYAVRGQCCKSLAEIKAPGAFDVLANAFRQDSYQDGVRRSALEALGSLKDPRGVDLAMKWSAYGKPESVRLTSAKVLGTLGAEIKDQEDRCLERLTELLDDPYFRMPRSAVEGLQALGHPSAKGDLNRIMAQSPEWRLKHSAWKAIRAIEEKDTSDLADLESKVEALEETNRRLQEQIQALSEKLDKE